MSLHEWVVALITECTSYRPDAEEPYDDQGYQLLNSMFAMGWVAEDWGTGGQSPRLALERMMREERSSAYVAPLVEPKVCGHVANWLCRMMVGAVFEKLDTSEVIKLGFPPTAAGFMTRSFDEIRSKLTSRTLEHHYILRIDSKPLGHAYVLYLPPLSKEGRQGYYLYQSNINEELPELTLSEWLAEEKRCVVEGNVLEHIENLRRLDEGMGDRDRKWVIDTFTLKDFGKLTFDERGSFTGGKLVLRDGPMEGRVGHRFCLYRVDPAAFRNNISKLYVRCGLPDPKDVLTDD